MAVKDAEKSKEGTKKAEGSEQDKVPTEADKAAQELLDEIKAEEATEKKDESGSTEEPEKGESEAESKGEEGASEDEPETQTGEKKKKKSGFARRNSRLVKQRDEAKGEVAEKDAALNAEREAGKLKDLRIAQLEEQTQAKVVEPNPDDFDGGNDDPDFVAKKKEFDNANIKKLVSEQVAQAAKQGNEATIRNHQANDLKQKQEEHWEQADEMGNQDYDEKEGKLIDLIGKDMVNHIIANCPGDSHKVVYYMGTNEDEALTFAEDIANASTMPKAVMDLGAIRERLRANPQTLMTPDPDEETQGSAPSAQESLERQLDKLRKDAIKTGRLDKLLSFKKRARERGIELK